MIQLPYQHIRPQRLAVKLKPSAEKLMMKTAHPWIFSKSIEKINKEGKAGDLVILFGQKANNVIGVGLYDPNSPIRIKMLHYYSGITVDQSFFFKRIKKAFEKRKPLLDSNTNSYRLIFGENDGFPGLIADVYDKVLVVKLYSEIWYPYLEEILNSMLQLIAVQAIVLRLSRSLQQKDLFDLKDGMIVYGSLTDEEVQFIEYGVRFSANVIKGHKTGFFLDHRENRRRVGKLSSGKTVLDVFSYAGGFAVHALVGGAKEVSCVDVSKQALKIAKANAALNAYENQLQTYEGDAFEVLQQFIKEGKTFDVIVIDPPSFAKSQKEINIALKKYDELASLGAQLVEKKGVLILASCSSRVKAEDFFKVTKNSLVNSGRKFKLLEQTFHDIDHPITFEEGAYLKCAYYSFY